MYSYSLAFVQVYYNNTKYLMHEEAFQIGVKGQWSGRAPISGQVKSAGDDKLTKIEPQCNSFRFVELMQGTIIYL